MHLILTGATGLVGTGVLEAMIKTPDITKISILSRRPVKMAEDVQDPRINVIIHKDYTQYDQGVLDQLKGASGCVWAQGISQTQVNLQDYIEITKTYPLKAAEAFRTLPDGGADEPFRFIYVSGDGATLKPSRWTSTFGRVKGEAEAALAAMRKTYPNLHAASMRPSCVDELHHDSVKQYFPRRPIAWVRVTAPVVLPAIKFGLTTRWTPTDHLGKFLTEMAMGKWDGKLTGHGVEMIGEFPIVENWAHQRLTGYLKAPKKGKDEI